MHSIQPHGIDPIIPLYISGCDKNMYIEAFLFESKM